MQAQSPAELLQKANKKKSNKLLYEFFDFWNKDILPISDTELASLNDTIKYAYQAFSAFYKPQSIDSLGGSEWGNDIYADVDFLIVQNSVDVFITDKIVYTEQEVDDYVVDYINTAFEDDSFRTYALKRTNGKLAHWAIEEFGPNSLWSYERKDSLFDSITNFRPRIKSNGPQPLYLSKKYNELLNDFLGNRHHPLGAGGIMNPARSIRKSKKRKAFLEHYIKIWYGHWGGYWQLHSYPKAYKITFDANLQYARIDFRMVYQGGDAILKLENGNWELVSSQITWIE